MSIKSRKRPVSRAVTSQADTRALGLMLAALPGLAFAAAPQSSQEAERTLRGVVVSDEVEGGYRADTASSPKFTQPLLDTPQTVTVITKELLDDQGLGSLADALRNTPGITFTLGENGNTTAGDSVTMRGFDTAGSIFVDGVRDLGAVSRDTFNTEQIEVVKGPSGSDNGRGAPTGYINLSSKQPTLEDAVSSKLAFGTDNRVRVEGDLNQTLGIGQGTAARFNMMYDRGDKPGRGVADNSRWGFAPALALGLGTETRAYFNYQFVKQVNTPDGGLPPVGLDSFDYQSALAAPAGSSATQVANVAALNAAINAAVAGADEVDRDNFYGSADDFEHVRANMFTFRLEHDLNGSTTLRNTSRYGRQSLRRLITGVGNLVATSLYTGGTPQSGTATVTSPDTWTATRSRQRRDEVNEVLTNQTNLTAAFATGAVGHSLSTGVEFIYERQQNLGMTTGTQVAANLYNPNRSDAFFTPVPSGAFNDGKTLTGAAYVFDTLQLVEKLSLNVGVRYDRYRTEYAAVPAPVVAPATPAASTYAEADGELFTGKVGLVFKPVENGSLYTAIASSELPPGGASTSANAAVGNGANNNFVLVPGTATNINNPNLDPQKARNIEVGTKWDLLDNRLVVTAAAFDTRTKNDLATQDSVTLEVTQFGERRVRGFELGASGMITANWQVTAGFSSMDTKVLEGTITGNATTGAQLSFTPKTSFTSWTTYRLPIGLTIGGGARYTASQFRNATAAQATQANLATNPSAWVVDAMASYDVNERIGVQLNVQNVTDKFYLSSVNNAGNRFVLGAPRTVLLSGNVKFY